MANTLPNSTAIKKVADYMREGSAWEKPLDSEVIDRLIAAGVTLGPRVEGGDITVGNGTTGATKNALGNHQVAGLLNLILKYNGGGSYDVTPVQTAVNLLLQTQAYELPISETIAKLLLAFANSASFPSLANDFLSALRDAPNSTLLYLLYWVGTVSPANPYTF